MTIMRNSQIIERSASDSEETIFAPGLTPTVSTDPVIIASARICSKANQRNDVVRHWERVEFRIDAARVCLELSGGTHGARHRSASVDFRHDRCRIIYPAVFGHLEAGVLGNCIATRCVTAAALMKRCTTAVLRSIVVARFMRDAIRLGVSPHARIVSPFAAAGAAAIDHVLCGQQHLVRPLQFASNANSIRKRRCAAVRPTAAAILRNVLVANFRTIVCSINTSPVPVLWNVLGPQQLVRQRRNNMRGPIRSAHKTRLVQISDSIGTANEEQQQQ